MSESRASITAVLRRRRFNLIWLVPIVAAGISLYLGVRYLSDRGPLVTITFLTANGITAGQTLVEHKAVALGTVENVHLSHDLTHVVVHVRMKREGDAILTNHARFWVVRPRLTPGNISGLETLVSGAYIEVDPGTPGGTPTYKFTGLEEPPGVRSDEPGTTFRLRAVRLGSISVGTPVFYRDVDVGEVLNYDLGNGTGPVEIRIFVRAPYDKFVDDGTLFWNASGLSVTLGAQGVHVEIESLQAILSGGVAFKTPPYARGRPRSAADSQFRLYTSEGEADTAGFTRNIPFVTYFTSAVGGLTRGSPVVMFGLQIGIVTDVRLALNAGAGEAKARVAFDLQPQRIPGLHDDEGGMSTDEAASAFVRAGLRAVLASSNIITGQQAISLQYVPNAPAARLSHEGDALVVPSQSGGIDNIMSSLSDIATKLDAIPFDQIGRDLASTMHSLNEGVNGAELRQSMHDLSVTLGDIRQIARKANEGLTPALRRLPQLAQDLQQTVAKANSLLGENGYGGNSDFSRNMNRLLDQVNDAARSIRLLADFLDRHPEALLLGRSGRASER
ncbi:MAG TPA: MlaD family protein [Acetobacteraceae bacterium]|nr:MlaD family protein [Acetobacteraceae bacterium]